MAEEEVAFSVVSALVFLVVVFLVLDSVADFAFVLFLVDFLLFVDFDIVWSSYSILPLPRTFSMAMSIFTERPWSDLLGSTPSSPKRN